MPAFAFSFLGKGMTADKEKPPVDFSTDGSTKPKGLWSPWDSCRAVTFTGAFG